ncbi:MAG: DUF433 domain-containing protein [Saprospiraceae bacterium]
MSDIKNPELLKRITVKPGIMLGKPTIRGTRLTVEHLLKAMAAGLTFEQLHDDYPFLEAEDLSAYLLYASQLVENERVFAVTA